MSVLGSLFALANETDSTGHMVFAVIIFVAAAISCALISVTGNWVEKRVKYTRWEDIALFPFIMLAFLAWAIAVCSFLMVVVGLLVRVSS